MSLGLAIEVADPQFPGLHLNAAGLAVRDLVLSGEFAMARYNALGAPPSPQRFSCQPSFY